MQSARSRNDVGQPARESARLSQAIERVAILRHPYSRAVQRLIVTGDPLALDLLVRPVDAARQRATECLSDFHAGICPEGEVVDAHDLLARLMVAVIRQTR